MSPAEASDAQARIRTTSPVPVEADPGRSACAFGRGARRLSACRLFEAAGRVEKH